jgi:hypothetical protein
MSAYLIYEVHSEGVSRDRICHTAGAILSNPIGSAPLDREKFERAKYLFDKAACSVSGIDPK